MNEIPQELHIGTLGDLALPVFVLGIVAALAILGFAWLSRRHYLALPELKFDRAAAAAPPLDHCVVIPARNEEANIARCVGSFEGSVRLVVDDHSSDRTAALAEQAGATVRSASPLPPKWLGKPHACWEGSQWTESDWIAFVDADTWYAPGFLPSLLAYAGSRQLQAATVFPRQEFGSWWERLLLPYALGLYFTGVSATKVNNPNSREALANGQCLLFLRSAYQFIGGHAAVASSVIEDVALARLIKRHRMTIGVLRCETMAHVRMYRTFGDLWRGFQKNSFRFLRVNPKTLLLVVTSSIVMTSWLPVLAALLWQQHWGLAAFFFFVPTLAWRPWYRSWFQALAAPLAIYVFQAIALCGMAAALFGLSTHWKGRRV